MHQLTRLITVTALLGTFSSLAYAEDDTVYARVIVEKTDLRSGPSPNFRRVGVARRGKVFKVMRRGTRGYWFQIRRDDGTKAWILGDTVYNHQVGEGSSSDYNGIFAPPPLFDARIEIAAVFGVLGGGGLMAVRPTVLIGPVFGVELNAGASVARAGRLFIFGAGGVVNLFPRSPVVPFFVGGGGVALSDPNADTFLIESGVASMIYGGGGFRIGFKHRLTLRIEARGYAFFQPDRYVGNWEASGGLSVFF